MSLVNAQDPQTVPAQRPQRGFYLAPLLRLDPQAASLTHLRTGCFDHERYDHLQSICDTFVSGYNLALGASPLARLEQALDARPGYLGGFLVEGAAMGSAVRDSLSVRGGHLRALQQVFGPRYSYLIQVGTGWALARVPWIGSRLFHQTPPGLFTLTLDGRGFHDAFFRPHRPGLGRMGRGTGLSAKAYDQGIGRALWFLSLARGDLALRLIAEFDPARHNDLAAGLGLAMAYAGPASQEMCAVVAEGLSAHRAALAQGAAFAALARATEGLVNDNLETVSRTLTQLSAAEAAALARRGQPAGVPEDRAAALMHYQHWRQNVQDQFPARFAAPRRGA